jgi:hypothetical protein
MSSNTLRRVAAQEPLDSTNEKKFVVHPRFRRTWQDTVAIDRDIHGGAELRLALLISNYVNCITGQCNPKIRTLADRLGITVRQVKRLKRSLQRKGYLGIDGKGPDAADQLTLLLPTGSTDDANVTPDDWDRGDMYDVTPSDWLTDDDAEESGSNVTWGVTYGMSPQEQELNRKSIDSVPKEHTVSDSRDVTPSFIEDTGTILPLAPPLTRRAEEHDDDWDNDLIDSTDAAASPPSCVPHNGDRSPVTPRVTAQPRRSATRHVASYARPAFQKLIGRYPNSGAWDDCVDAFTACLDAGWSADDLLEQTTDMLTIAKDNGNDPSPMPDWLYILRAERVDTSTMVE